VGTDTSLALRAAAALIATQGLAAAAAGVFLAVRGLGGDAGDIGRAELGAVLAFAGGVLLVVLAKAQLGRRRWARGPTIVLELLCLPVGWGLLQGHRPDAGVPLMVVAVAVLVLLAVGGAFAPETE
jgi:hypothetical protein